MKVATIQFAPTFGDKKASLRRLAGLVIEAAQSGAELIVMPELAAVGYGFMNETQAESVSEVISQLPSSDPEYSVGVMRALASKYGTHLVWGLVEKDPGTNKLYNSQVLMCPDGRFESVRKINLFGNDFLWASEGRANPPVVPCDFKEGTKRVGLLICRDVRDKKDDTWTAFYERGDADIVAFSANWGDGGFPAVSWMDFVKDNQVTLVVSNRYGKEIPNDFGEGGVCVIEPSGKVHCEGLVWNRDCIVYAEIA